MESTKKPRHILLLLACLLTPLVLGFGSSLLAGNIPLFYQNLQRPPLAPPPWLFGPVWTVLYLAMGLSFYLLWQSPRQAPARRPALVLLVLQFLLNFIWSPIFFGWGSLWAAFGVILALDAAVLAACLLAFRVRKAAGFLLLPYLAWISFASYLTLGSALLNP